jgi:hypothetical protein
MGIHPWPRLLGHQPVGLGRRVSANQCHPAPLDGAFFWKNTVDEIEKLRADLVLAGWRIERNSLNDRMNLVDWYAWHPMRPEDWPTCQCNDKPPSLCIYPHAFNLPQQEKTFANVEDEVCGELAGRWYKLRSYSITAGEAMAALPKITESLGAAWKAIAALDTQPA